VSYIRFQFDTKKLKLREPYIRLYPLVCMHLGSPQCDVKFLTDHVKRIKADPAARWVYLGDGGECVTTLSKGDIYGQLLSPQLQQEALLDILAPIRERGLFGVRGNHGHRVYKETGLSFDHTLCARLGIPYMGVGTQANIVVNRSSYDTYWHHGTDSGVSLRAKIAAAEAYARFINADAIFTAHSHVAMELTPAALREADNIGCKERTKMRKQFICGCAYDSRTGYAEDKGYPPLLPAYLAVQLDGRIILGHGQKYVKLYDKWESTAPDTLDHTYIQKYLNRRVE
jgi:hypothetical protein